MLPQRNKGLIEALKLAKKNAVDVIKAYFGANLLFSLFSAGALQYLWGLINSLQMIVLTALFAIKVPFNAEMIMIAILKMVQLDFIPVESYLTTIFNFRDTKPFFLEETLDGESYSKFEEVGYDSSNFIMLIGPIFFFLLAYLAFQIVRCPISFCIKKCKCRDNCFTRPFITSNRLIFIMRFVLEGCVEIGLSALIAVKMMDKEVLEDNWEVMGLALAFISLLLLLATPFYYCILVRKFLREKELPKEEQ